jgi:hypothetical protein
VNGTRKQTKKKEDKNKLTTVAVTMVPILHNTLLVTTKIKFFLGHLPIFGAHQPTHQPQFLWAQTQILLWGNLSFWGGSQTQMLLRGPILGVHWGLLGFRGSKSNFTLGTFSFWGVSQTQILLRGYSPFLGPFGVQGLKINLILGLLFIVRVPNSNLT